MASLPVQLTLAWPAACCLCLLQVLESWAAILRGVRPNAFKISLEDVRVFALSKTTGLVTCVEVVEADDSKGRWVRQRAGGSHICVVGVASLELESGTNTPWPMCAAPDWCL
jgi:hypothetical protein